MARPESEYPTQSELEILKVLWRDGPSTVRQVRDAMSRTQTKAFNTVDTIMKIMVRKGYLKVEKRRRIEGGDLFVPTVKRESVAGQMIRGLSKRIFGKSIAGAMQSLLTSGELDRKELEEIKQIFEKDQTEPGER